MLNKESAEINSFYFLATKYTPIRFLLNNYGAPNPSLAIIHKVFLTNMGYLGKSDFWHSRFGAPTQPI